MNFSNCELKAAVRSDLVITRDAHKAGNVMVSKTHDSNAATIFGIAQYDDVCTWIRSGKISGYF